MGWQFCLPLRRLDSLPVHEGLSIPYLNKHVTEPAVPNIAKDTVSRQRELRLCLVDFAYMDLRRWRSLR